MAKQSKSKEIAKQDVPFQDHALKWLLWGGTVVTLFIWSNLDDPFNAPKAWILYIVGAYLTGWVIFQIQTLISSSILKKTSFVSGGFVLAMFVAFLFTNEKFVGFFGESGRRTGFLNYYSLTIFFLVSAMIFRLSNLEKFFLIVLINGSIVSIYGFFQHFNLDFIKWNNPYNSVLSTLGNPDFASALMGILLVLSVGIIINKKINNLIRCWAVANSVILTITILFSQARQGLLAALLGISLIIVVFTFQKKRILGWFTTGVGAVSLTLGIFGMLNKGPAARYLYKISITYRGDYWRAGLNMFKHNPIFGVGLDSFGTYFPTYRDSVQSLRRGPNVVSNAAHNVPIQFAATGGIFVFLFYICLTGFVAWRCVLLIQKTHGNEKLIVSAIVGAWLAYEAQSFISIDNIAIAVWGWILSGLIVGLTIFETRDKRLKHDLKQNKVIKQALSSRLLAILVIALVIPLFLADSQARLVRAYGRPAAAQMNSFSKAVMRPLMYGFQDPSHKLLVATAFVRAGQNESAIRILKSLAKTDPQNFQALTYLALIFEQELEPANAVEYRKLLLKIDPFNQLNLLKLGEDLKAMGDVTGAKSVIPLIDAFASNTPEAAKAKSELGA